MSDYKKELGLILEGMHRQKNEYEKELLACPRGRLWKTRRDGMICYFLAYKEGDRYVRRMISSDDEMKQALARKAFLEKNLRKTENNIAVLSRAFGRIEATGFHDIIRELPRSYQTLPREYFAGEEETPYLLPE